MRRGGISVVEYAVMIVCIAAAIIAMSTYLRRSLNAKWRESADTFGFGAQYEPGVTIEN